jgi:putative ubiquitin-RnfH superfamily antitoxin RatB of RatAB toxin-antitoxin module
MKVTVVWATPRVQDIVPVDVPPGATAADAIVRSGLAPRYGLEAARMVVAIFGRRAPLHTQLAEGDRIEITRPLTADPKEARRLRARAKPHAPAVPKAKRSRVR